MKINFLSLIFLCSVFFNATNVFAKKDTTIVYCNKYLNKVKTKYAPFYIKVFRRKDGEIGVLQYTRDNYLYMKGSFLDEKLNIKQGLFEYYYAKEMIKEKGQYENNEKEGLWLGFAKNGMIISKDHYENNEKEGVSLIFAKNGTLISNGYYKNNKKDRLWECFSENGRILSKGEYLKGNRTGSWVFYDDSGSMTDKSNYLDGKLDGEELRWYKDTLISIGHYESGEKDGHWKTWYRNRKMNQTGGYNIGKRQGEWKFYFKSGNLAALEEYVDGEAMNVNWFSETGESVEPIAPYELSPKFPGDEYGMALHIQETFEYPGLARELGEQGTVWVEFKIYPDGAIRDVKVVVSVSSSIDTEVLRVIELMPNWIPGLDHNRKMPIRFTLPIRCRLG
jgi:TonB family protein